MGNAKGNTMPKIRGVGMFESTDYTTGLNGVSFAGGADAVIHSTGLQVEPSENIVYLTTEEFGHRYLEFKCPKLTILDEFNSKAEEGRLSYRIPSAVDMINSSVTINDLKGIEILFTKLKVQSGSDLLFCKEKEQCKVNYRWDFTPILYYVSNPIMYHGMNTSIYFDSKEAFKYKRDDKDFADVRLGGKRFLTADYTPEWRTRGGTKGLRGTVHTTVRSMDAELNLWFRGVGNALRVPETSQTCNWDGTDCYFVRIYPSIEDISNFAGSLAGG